MKNAATQKKQITRKSLDEIRFLMNHPPESKLLPLSEILLNVEMRAEALRKHDPEANGALTGFRKLDCISALQKSKLVILGARPSTGKTSFALMVARNVAIHQHKPVLIFSTDLDSEQIAARLVAQESGIPLWKILTDRLTKKERKQTKDAAKRIASVPIYVYDLPFTVTDICMITRKFQEDKEIGLVIIDDPMLLDDECRTESEEKPGYQTAWSLKLIAQELSVPVLMLYTLDSGSIGAPRLSYLRHAGRNLERFADAVMFLYRKDRDPNAIYDQDEEGATQVIVAKHRNGGLGVVDLTFNPELASFNDQ